MITVAYSELGCGAIQKNACGLEAPGERITPSSQVRDTKGKVGD